MTAYPLSTEPRRDAADIAGLRPDRARDKIKTVEEAAAFAKDLRARGHSVVLAHGCFDLMHMGHVRHLEAARAEGDALIVTVTADRYVNKGPGRPVFPELFRAEMIAALECVDGVAISRWPTAEGVLRLVRPDVYVKGSDYRDARDDLTGMIAREREIVESGGGRIAFTDDITFSSSALINRHLSVFDPAVNAYLAELRAADMLGAVLEAVESVRDKRVLLVGDAIIDEYQYAAPMGKSAKENIIASRFESREVFAGGVAAAANHVADFCAEVEVITVLGDQESHEGLIRENLKDNVSVEFLVRQGVPTTRKCRFVEPGHMRKLFEVYHFDDTPISGRHERQLCELIARRAPDFDLVVVADFGHGMMTPAAIDAATGSARALAVNAQSNSANHGYNLVTKYRRADYVCIDEPEARLAMADRTSDLGDLIEHGLSAAAGCDRIVVTHGQNGCLSYGPGEGIRRVPAFTRQVVDTVGAGDAFFSVTAPLAVSGVPMGLVGFVGNAVGALKVGIVGHRKSVEKVPLLKFITSMLK